MKKYILVKGDTNDADFTSEKTEITDEEIELIRPVIEVLKNRELERLKNRNNHELSYNWWNCDGNRVPSPKKMYVDTGLITEEQLDEFERFVPRGENGIHTIEEIEIIEVIEKLF